MWTYQIFDCYMRPVGRKGGYKTHSRAAAQITRRGRIRTAVYDAFDGAKRRNPDHALVYAIKLERVTPSESSPEPSPAQLDALRVYAAMHGRRWKDKLYSDWASGRDACRENGELLRQIRNQFGPLWLDTFRL